MGKQMQTTETYYEIGGQKYPRVTKIIGEFLEKWDAIAPNVLERAAEFGNSVHLATEYDDQNQLDVEQLDEALLPCVEAWRNFKKRFNVEIESIEPIVFSQKYGYAGRADRIGILKGQHYVIDIKTCAYKRLTHNLQVAAYQAAWNELNPKQKAKKRCLVELHRDGKFKFFELNDENDLPLFLSALALYKWKQGAKK